MKARANIAFAVLGAALALLAGCASDPVTRYYVLAATAPASSQPPAPKAMAVVIRDVRLPQYLERTQIVTRGSDHRLLMADYELWAGDLRQDMTRVLAENLSRLLASDQVVAAPHTLKLAPDVRVEVEVQRFERDAAGKVELAARWWLTRGSDGALLASPSAALAGTPLGANASYEAVVASMSAVYGQLAQEIARSIRAKGAGGT
ncbi:MAG: membrane integrity-associated transporter subunit PqiC [Proteobacteria bacterium]|nr:membrane integrity-associated transporter subunit PqiC [Pseudomonadota bacterium]